MRFRHWAPPLAWMGVIFWFSSAAWSGAATASWMLPLLQALFPPATTYQLEFLHMLVRKLAHVIEYALLAFLWRRGLAQGSGLGQPRREWVAFGTSVGYAVFDEIHQGWTGVRGASPFDVALDGAGAGAALLLLRFGWRRALTFFTGLLLWATALGGTLFLLLNLSLGVNDRRLWISAPLGWIALWAWRRLRQRPPPGPRAGSAVYSDEDKAG